jgi:cyanophycinase
MSPQPTARWYRTPPRIRWIGWAVLLATAVWGGTSIRERILHISPDEDTGPLYHSRGAGLLYLVGGGDLPDRVTREFIELGGGPAVRLVVIPGAAVEEDRQRAYREYWQSRGVQDVTVLHADSRTLADDQVFSEPLLNATAVWLGGGQQTWFTAWYRGTLVERRLKELLDRGGVIGGTSAGASAVSEIMMAGGRRGEPVVSHGLGLLPDVVVDQHFFMRNRPARLLNLLQEHPGLIGLGIDERTAAVIELQTRRVSVVGSSYVMVVLPARESRLPRIEVLKAGDSLTFDQLRSPVSSDLPEWLEDAILLPD